MVKKRTDQEAQTLTEPITITDTEHEGDLRSNLEEINTYHGVIGYIFRNSTSAAIALKDPTRIIDYAILSSVAIETSDELRDILDLGEIRNIVMEGSDIKVLSLTVGENKISVFTEKNAEAERILRKLGAL